MSHQPHDEHAAHEAPASHGAHEGHDASADHSKHAGHGDHGEMFKRRFWISLLLSIPVLIFSTTIQGWLNFSPPAFTGDESIAPLFGTAIFLIFAILLAQFNRFISVILVLSAVILSTIGVLLGLMIMGQPFGVVMTGIGIIANAGVIVNNNIVLIDTYDRLRREGQGAYEAILETCRERARPVVLTAVTAILGVLPIAFGINLDFIGREITHGAQATQWWISLSTAIVFGLGFATILTLIVTPAALMGIANMAEKRDRWIARWRDRHAAKSGVPAE